MISIINHNRFPDLQGGAEDEYYHLTAADLAKVTTDAWVKTTGDVMTGSLDMSDNPLLDVDYIDFNLINGLPHAEGRLAWNGDDGALEVGMPGGVVKIQLGQELGTRSNNDELVQIDNGKVIRVSGGTGNFAKIKLADNSSIVTAGAIGFATENILPSQKGYTTHFGLVRDVDTEGMPAGSLLWLSTNGDYTTTVPSAPSIKVIVGIVIREHANEGIILATLQTVPRLVGLSDVDITSLTGGDVLVFDAATGTWLNSKTLSGVDIILDKAAGTGIRVDPVAPTYGWRDIIGEVFVKVIGSNDPEWLPYRGSINQYRFTNGPQFREVWLHYHIPHDYVPGTDLYVHTHWSQIVVDSGGDAKWYFDISYAKGHGIPGGVADTFNDPIVQSVVQQASTTQYGHMIAEVAFTNDGGDATHLDRNDIEVDGVVLIRLYRDSTDVEDTLDQHPFVHYSDIHYQSTNVGTKQKAPDFYV